MKKTRTNCIYRETEKRAEEKERKEKNEGDKARGYITKGKEIKINREIREKRDR